MKKKCKALLNKLLSTIMVLGMMFQVLAPTMVLAVTFQDANTITIGGTPTISGSTFNYENGSVIVTKNNVAVNTITFTVAQDDEIKIELVPADGYNAKLHNNSQANDDGGHDVELVNNIYQFTIGVATQNNLTLTPSFSNNSGQFDNSNSNSIPDPTPDELKFDFTINGESFENVSLGDVVIVPDDFNMNSLEEFYVTKIVDGERRTYIYEDEEYAYELLDSQNRHIFEAHFVKQSNNYVRLRVESHSQNILSADLERFGKIRDDYFGFYITGINFVKNSFRGVEISTNVMPDNYDFTVWNGVDLGETTLNNPGTVTAYYDEDIISFNSGDTNPVKKIELVEGKGVPSSAVEINDDNGTIKILSNYYNQVLLKVELKDGTIGYVNVDRIGLFIGDLNKNQNTFYHGAANDLVSGNLNVETSKQRLVAVFYHEKSTTYEDYDLIVNITYTNGETETKMATGVGDVNNMSGDIVGSDYLLWSGDSLGIVKNVSVTAVKKGAITNEKTFGGAEFGSGSGVVWERD